VTVDDLMLAVQHLRHSRAGSPALTIEAVGRAGT
jgi:hypothetical protein